ncbi:MAG: DUF47 family protein [Halobacteria archaeon]
MELRSKKHRPGLLSLIVPAEKRFFEMLERQAQKAEEGVRALYDLLKNFTDVEEKARILTQIENEGDEIRHEISHEVNSTFITPLDREDINTLSVTLDDLLDYAEGISTRTILFEIKSVPKEVVDLASVFLRSVEAAHKAVAALESPEEAIKHVQAIHRLENEADHIYRTALANLFKEKDVMHVLKIKEIVETLEGACDKCEDIADVIDEIAVKSR